MIGELWHQAKAKLGSRSSRKRGWKVRGGVHPRARVRAEYDLLLKSYVPPAPVFFGIDLAVGLSKTVYSIHDAAGAITHYGSQRKAAAALGISLGKLQRALRKAA
jgi:hypothetical protein